MAPPSSRNAGLWYHYWATWRTMFAIQSMSLILGLSVAIPLISLATSRALASSENIRISDTDLLDFLFGSNFPLIVIAAVVLWVTIHVFGYAAQLFAAHASLHETPVSVFTAIRKTSRHLPTLTLLAFRFFIQLFVIALPFLLIITGILSLQFQDKDLSEYLIKRPPEFILAIAFASAIFALMTVVLLQVTTRWAYALPLLLFSGESPSSARRLSRRKSQANRHRLFIPFALWTVSTPLLVLILNLGWLPLALWATELIGHRLGLLALVLSLLVFVAVGIASLTGFISLTLLAIRHVGFFHEAGLDHAPLEEDEPSPSPLIGRLLAAAVILAGLLTIGLTYRWLDDLRIADHARVIAFRGASQGAPENSIAAINRAWDHGAHGIAVDVRQGGNQELLVFADADFSRIAKLPLKLDEATENDLNTIDIGSWKNPKFHEERVPTLDQIIELTGRQSSLMLLLPDLPNEKQRETLVLKIVGRLEQADISRRTRIVCARSEHVPDARTHAPKATVGFRSREMIDGPIGAPVDFIIVPAGSLRSDLVDNLHSQGIEVFASETRDPAVMSAVLSRGADGLLIDTPSLGHKVLEERATLNPGERLLLDFIIRARDFLPPPPTRNSVSQ